MRYARQLNSDEAREILAEFDKTCKNPTDEQRKARDKLEWVTNNASKLKAMFMGMVDMTAEADVGRCMVTLRAVWSKFDEGPSRVLH